ncbi:MAG: hypothetical protein PHC50_03475 [Candidatus Cloacimonetes bacterium]|nr:hypothetical protein [Candidatus Cloacimonadota bacterium]
MNLNVFLSTYRKPYSLAQLSEILGRPVSEISPAHRRAIKKGMVANLGDGIFVSKLCREASFGTVSWRYDADIARYIIQELGKRPAFSSRALSERICRSHEFCSKYLAALIHIDAVIVKKTGYHPGPNQDLSLLGISVPRDVIRLARQKAGIY